jgi:hypothetical protein
MWPWPHCSSSTPCGWHATFGRARTKPAAYNWWHEHSIPSLPPCWCSTCPSLPCPYFPLVAVFFPLLLLLSSLSFSFLVLIKSQTALSFPVWQASRQESLRRIRTVMSLSYFFCSFSLSLSHDCHGSLTQCSAMHFCRRRRECTNARMQSLLMPCPNRTSLPSPSPRVSSGFHFSIFQ